MSTDKLPELCGTLKRTYSSLTEQSHERLVRAYGETCYHAGRRAAAAPAQGKLSALPDLPKPVPIGGSPGMTQLVDGYTEAQMRAYGQLCRDTASGTRAADADDNAPWLTLAHTICADAGILCGDITARLTALRDRLDAARPAPVGAGRAPDRRRCKPCAAIRGGDNCWKCGAATFEPHPSCGDEPALPPIDRIRALAKEVGYAIGVHGSQQRDFDVIAAPWTDSAIGNYALLQHIAAGLTTDNGPAHIISTERKPLGRYAATIQMDGWYKQLDISVCPNEQYAVFAAAPAAPIVAEPIKRYTFPDHISRDGTPSYRVQDAKRAAEHAKPEPVEPLSMSMCGSKEYLKGWNECLAAVQAGQQAGAVDGEQQAITDEQLIGVLHALGIDTRLSVNGFDALQVDGTNLPGVRAVVMNCINSIADGEWPAPIYDFDSDGKLVYRAASANQKGELAMKPSKQERPLQGKSDEELVDAARMHSASLSELHLEIAARGIEIDVSHYTSGRYETRYYRKTETDL